MLKNVPIISQVIVQQFSSRVPTMWLFHIFFAPLYKRKVSSTMAAFILFRNLMQVSFADRVNIFVLYRLMLFLEDLLPLLSSKIKHAASALHWQREALKRVMSWLCIFQML